MIGNTSLYGYMKMSHTTLNNIQHVLYVVINRLYKTYIDDIKSFMKIQILQKIALYIDSVSLDFHGTFYLS